MKGECVCKDRFILGQRRSLQKSLRAHLRHILGRECWQRESKKDIKKKIVVGYHGNLLYNLSFTSSKALYWCCLEVITGLQESQRNMILH